MRSTQLPAPLHGSHSLLDFGQANRLGTVRDIELGTEAHTGLASKILSASRTDRIGSFSAAASARLPRMSRPITPPFSGPSRTPLTRYSFYICSTRPEDVRPPNSQAASLDMLFVEKTLSHIWVATPTFHPRSFLKPQRNLLGLGQVKLGTRNTLKYGVGDGISRLSTLPMRIRPLRPPFAFNHSRNQSQW